MSISDIDPTKNSDTLIEAQLQYELRSLFIVDTQHALQRYSQIAEQLQPQAWTDDIRELYRCIHTIKGGAVTVAADSILQVATVVEDLLSDLRYLELAPALADDHLRQTLLEIGELLTGTLTLTGVDEFAQPQIEPVVKRVQVLHTEIRDRYLPQWNEQRQLHQEFAEQGLDLIVLDLEIALEQTPPQEIVPTSLVATAHQTLAQLESIGQDLQLASGWNVLLKKAQALFDQPQVAIWRSQWIRLFAALKTCAKQSGNPVIFEIDLSSSPTPAIEVEWALEEPSSISEANLSVSTRELGHFLDSLSVLGEPSDDTPSDVTDVSLAGAIDDIAAELTNAGTFLDGLNFSQSLLGADLDIADSPDLSQPAIAFTDLNPELDAEAIDWSSVDSTSDQGSSDDIFINQNTVFAQPESSDTTDLTNQIPSQATPPTTTNQVRNSPSPSYFNHSNHSDKVQIPVPLTKLDQSSQYLVETLLTARTIKGIHQQLHAQIHQLVHLAQESAQSITHLRQIQDDYALLDNLKSSAAGPTPERYRQGYTVINRLLESNLRLSELGKETERTTRQMVERLQNLDAHLLNLQTTVEETRLVPFQNLGVRARAILRDLIIRYGKPTQLVIQGEHLELDVSTARALEPALLHLIRNAYDHGLESPDQRLAQGKPAQGTITLSLQRRGNTFQLQLRDDGRGIDAAAVRSRAEGLQLPLTQTPTAADLLAVICQPGFSSETQVSELSGRGVGMDVISTQILQLNGKLRLDTTPGMGTTFQLQFPVPHLLVPCLMLQVGDRIVAIPSEDIRTTALFDLLPVTQLESGPYPYHIDQGTHSAPALDLLNYWLASGVRSLPDTAVCVYIHPPDAAQGIWLIADELLEQTDLLINPLPAPLIAPQGLLGVSLQTNGSLIAVLDAAALTEPLATPRSAPHPLASEPAKPDDSAIETIPLVLIVDDAALIRRRIEASLTAYGYLSHTCADGLEAWNWLQKNPAPALMITDIEMPNMDGFTLIDRCRQSAILTSILVISSRLSEEWFDEAKRLGATDYLTKGFSTTELINKVKSLLP
jgi:chemotaxis protein histidine kinase CheA